MIHRFVDLFVEEVFDPEMIWNIRRQTGGTDRLFAMSNSGASTLADYLDDVISTTYTINKPELSPDLTEYIYIALTPPAGEKADIMRAPVDGLSSPTSIAKVPSAATGNPFGGIDIIGWSPDGQQVYYRGENTNVNRDTEIRVVDRDGTNDTLLWSSTTLESTDWGFLPRLSPDGTMFGLWIDFDGEPSMGLWVMDSDGTNFTQLYDSVSGGDFYGWSPDGEWLLFRDTDFVSTPRWERIFKIHPDGTGQTILYDRQISGTVEPEISLSFGQYSVWLPDSSGVVCKKNTGGGVDPDFEVGILDADGSETFTALSPQRLMFSLGAADAHTGPILNQNGTRLYWREGANLAAQKVVSALVDGSDYRVDDDMDTDPSHDDYIFTGFHVRFV